MNTRHASRVVRALESRVAEVLPRCDCLPGSPLTQPLTFTSIRAVLEHLSEHPELLPAEPPAPATQPFVETEKKFFFVSKPGNGTILPQRSQRSIAEPKTSSSAVVAAPVTQHAAKPASQKVLQLPASSDPCQGKVRRVALQPARSGGQ
jgi:hypothetical protein